MKHLLVCILVFFSAAAARADSAATGTLTGSVMEGTNGRYLVHAVVRIDHSAVSTLTDEYGRYQLANVPVGTVTVVAEYSGLPAVRESVEVAAAAPAQHDFVLGLAGTHAADGTVQLDAFVVAADLTMDNKALAINEQRVSPAIKTVVAADAFGDVTEGNVGEFLKYLPGVAVEYTAADARQIILRGVNPIYTAVSSDNNRLASAASSNAARYFELEQASINNVARIEVVFSRTPDLPADALGGSVNLISKTAFDYSHEFFSYRAYLSMNGDAKTLGTTPGPYEENSHKTLPGFDFTFVDPVNSKFGLVLNYLDSNIYYPQNRSQPFWSPTVTSGAGSTAANPFLHTYQLMVGPKTTGRRSLSADLDYRITPENILTLRPQWNFYTATFANRIINWNVQGTSNTAPVSFSSDGTQGAAGAGNVTYSSSFRNKFGATFTLDPTFVHTDPKWTVEAGASYSHATNHYSDVANGAPDNVALTEGGLTVGFAGLNQNNQVKPATITTTNAAGAQVNAFQNLSGYTINSFLSDPANSQDVVRSVKLNVTRRLNFNWPTSIKVGSLVQEDIRDIRKLSDTFDFVGPDGQKGTADDVAGNYMGSYNLVDAYSAAPAPYGFPKITWPNPYGVYDIYKANPSYFSLESNATTIKNSQWFRERISSAYLMGDTKSRNGKLRLVYGMRVERTDDVGQGYLFNPNAIYQTAADGTLLRTSAGKPIPIVGSAGLALNATSGGTTSQINATAVQASTLEYTDRGATATREYANGFPTADLIYNFTPNLIGRLSYTEAIGRPDLSNIIPGVGLPDPNAANPFAITVNNPALEPEKSNNYDFSLEYYFNKVGMVSVGAFRKDFVNFYGASTVLATQDLLDSLGVPNASYYLQNAATVTSKFNVGTARITGVQFSYSEALPFLPIDGFSVFANGFLLHLEGPPYADFSDFLPKSASWGLGFDRRSYSLKINWNYRGEERETTLSGEPGAYNYFHSRLQLDLSAEYRLTRYASIFFGGRNVTNVYQDYLGFGPVLPSYAHLQRRDEFGAQYTFGFKGTF